LVDKKIFQKFGGLSHENVRFNRVFLIFWKVNCMKCKILCILCLACAALFNAEGQTLFDRREIPSTPDSLQTQLMMIKYPN